MCVCMCVYVCVCVYIQSTVLQMNIPLPVTMRSNQIFGSPNKTTNKTSLTTFSI